MIPGDNIRNLVLKDEVVAAVRDGKFKIYAVSTIDEEIEILTGTVGRERGEDHTYAEGTVHQLVEKRLHEIEEQARKFGRGDQAKNEEVEGEP